MTDPDIPPSDAAIASALEDFHARKALGERPRVEDYAARLGAAFAEFESLVATEAELDRVIEPTTGDALPRPFGGYTLVRELGRGGVGIVYEAVDRRLGRTVAIKVLRSTFASDPAALARFRREASACARVRHDHIVSIFEAGEVDGALFYAMDLVAGESLSSKIAREVRLDAKALCRGLAPIASALEALHAAGIVHRDVKPQNVMVRPDGRMVLADFGLARTEDTAGLTQSGDAIGTPLYMSPEQMLGQRDEVDARTDVYGLGATLYEGLTGRPPFKSDSLHALMRMIFAERPISSVEIERTVPEACDRIVMKALEKRREDRYATAGAMEADLRAFAEDRPVVGRPVSPPVRAARALRRRWIPIVLATAAGVGGFVFWTHRPAELVVSSWATIDTRVVIDGTDRGPAPLSVSVPPGPHRLRLDNGRAFQAQEVDLVLAPGERSFHSPSLMPIDATDADTLRTLSNAMSLYPKGPTLPPGVRSAPGDPPAIDLIFPRGDVRPEDLERLAILLEDATEGATLEFRRGPEILASSAFASDSRWVYQAIPPAVVAAARTGDRIVWGVYPKAGARTAPVVAEIRIVDTDPSTELERIDSIIDERSEGLRHVFRAEALHKREARHRGLPRGVRGHEARSERRPGMGRGDAPPRRLGQEGVLVLRRRAGVARVPGASGPEGRADARTAEVTPGA